MAKDGLHRDEQYDADAWDHAPESMEARELWADAEQERMRLVAELEEHQHELTVALLEQELREVLAAKLERWAQQIRSRAGYDPGGVTREMEQEAAQLRAA